MNSRFISAQTRRPAGSLVVWLAFGLLVNQTSECEAAPPDTTIDSNRIVITLRDPGRIGSSILCVADVADLRGGDETLRRRIGELDLEDTPLAGMQTEITSRQIEFRLRVAGVDPQRVTVRGSVVRVAIPQAAMGSRISDRQVVPPSRNALFASRSRVRADIEQELDIEQTVLTAVRKCLSKQLPWPENNVDIQLAQPLPRELLERTLTAETTCLAELRTAGAPLGRVPVRIVLKAPGQRPLEVPLQLNVRHFEDVVVTTKPLARGHRFLPADLELGRQDVTQLAGYCTSAELLIGQQAKRILPAAQAIRTVDLEPVSRTAEPPLVKRRDRVKATGSSGVLSVTVVGEAMQDGRVGEIIKVRNIDSNTLLQGRVVNANEVQITE